MTTTVNTNRHSVKTCLCHGSKNMRLVEVACNTTVNGLEQNAKVTMNTYLKKNIALQLIGKATDKQFLYVNAT